MAKYSIKPRSAKSISKCNMASINLAGKHCKLRKISGDFGNECEMEKMLLCTSNDKNERMGKIA